MAGKYWLDVYTEESWKEHLNNLKNGVNVVGFKKSFHKKAKNIQIGDYFIAYVKGVSKFVGVSKITSTAWEGAGRIHVDDPYPIRFSIENVYRLELDKGIPIKDLKEKLSIFENIGAKNWGFLVIRSMFEYNTKDATTIIKAIEKAAPKPYDK